MGIVNTTPDSFSDGGLFIDPQRALSHALDMIAAGADIIDIGGESSRPGADSVSSEIESERVLPVVRLLRAADDVCISIDTVKPDVAQQALEAGATMINDISGCRDRDMIRIVKDHGVPVIIMHMKGTPKDMQKNPVYEDVIEEIKTYLSRRIDDLITGGVPAHHIIVDPGIGFGKSVADNFTLLRRLSELQSLDKPILIGPSRKSFIGMTLNLPPEDRLEGTIAATVAGVLQGARIVRVHDVKAVKRALVITEKLIPVA